eukprot:9121720-Alexandrium_andersonii.AAC.1
MSVRIASPGDPQLLAHLGLSSEVHHAGGAGQAQRLGQFSTLQFLQQGGAGLAQCCQGCLALLVHGPEAQAREWQG